MSQINHSHSIHKITIGKILSQSVSDVTLFFHEDYTELFYQTSLDGKREFQVELFQNIFALFHSITQDFRQEFVIDGCHVLVGLFPSQKEMRIYSPRLHKELFLLQNGSEFQNQSDFIELKNHVNPIVNQSPQLFLTEIERITRLHQLVDLQSLTEVSQKAEVYTQKLRILINDYHSSLFEKMSDVLLGLTAQYVLLRVHLLKFLAILPSLDHDQEGTEVKRILLESLFRFLKDNKQAKYLKKKGQERALPQLLTVLLKGAYQLARIIPKRPVAWIIRSSVKLMAKRFIAGESIEKAHTALKALSATKRDVTLDQLGELVVSNKEADHYMEEVLKLIRGFQQHVKIGELNASGINRAHVSIKVTALSQEFLPQDFQYTYQLVAPRLKNILLAAKEHQVFINIDAEHYHYRDTVFEVYQKVLLETPELHNFSSTGIVLQAYLRDAFLHLESILELAKKRNLPMPIRIVKGAYWDAETVEGNAHGFNAPQFLNKEETDIHFRQLVVHILKNHHYAKLCLASHNFSDHAFSEAVRDVMFPEAHIIEHQCLHMTYEALSTALAKAGWTVRNYVPVGSLLVGMAYLVRRIMENSSQVGVLTIMRSHKKEASLVSPMVVHEKKKQQGQILRDLSQNNLSEEFFNTAPLRIYKSDERESFLKKFHNFEKVSLGKFYGPVERQNDPTWEKVKIFCSSKPDLLVGEIAFFTKEQSQIEIEMIYRSFMEDEWPVQNPMARAATLLRAQEIMIIRRIELATLIMYEASKTLNEALLDVDEAIDFLNYYARQEVHIQKDVEQLIPRGPTIVVAPWNFPLAIPCGMCAGALVAGNTVILKSAEQTPLICELMTEIFYQAGVPKNVFRHTPGLGETVGDYLTSHEFVSTIIFTGSRAVGNYLFEKAQRKIFVNKRFQRHYPVKAITEMGGKNAVIVTQNAELDETVSGILKSAFNHSGQKCSALSRVIVHHSLKDKLIERLKFGSMDISVGSSLAFQTQVNPLISADDQKRVRAMVKEGEEELKKFGGRMIIDRSKEVHTGYNVGPVMIEISKIGAKTSTSLAQREVFGPVVHIVEFQELDEAIELFNCTPFALTGGIFSQSQDDIDYLSKNLECGNLYINRTITGARVGIEPFGGFKMSGTGPKAGGAHYVFSLHQSQVKIQESQKPQDSQDSQQSQSKNIVFSTQSSQKLSKRQFTLSPEEKFQLKFARESKLSFEMKEVRLKKFLETFLNSFESYVKEVRPDEKNHLLKFSKWVNRNYLEFFTEAHSNQKIPGQINVNIYDQFQKCTVYVGIVDRPHFKSIVQLLVALSTGSGVTVICHTELSFDFWSKIGALIYRSGFSKDNFKIYCSDGSLFTELLKSPEAQELGRIIYDGPVQKDYQEFVEQFYLHRCMDFIGPVQLLTVEDSFDMNDFYKLYLKFINVRSFAINTMRHGAPLDLEI